VAVVVVEVTAVVEVLGLSLLDILDLSKAPVAP
jgi:hypothetical protein